MTTMELTFLNDLGQSFVVTVDPNMELENVMALLEAESGIPVGEQSISHEGRDLNNLKATMQECGIGENAILLLRQKVQVAGRTIEQNAEMMRLQFLGDPNLMRELQETHPEIAAAAPSDPDRFAELLRQTRARQYEADAARQREIEALNADPFDVEARRRIEEAIRQQVVIENMEHAIEYFPESFGRVTMLYIPLVVNSKPVKAFVDSSTQQTIMSPECAEACGIMHLVDTRFARIARGVGTARILGRIHSAQIKLANLHLPCSFTIMEGRDVDLLFGLDMLKAHHACIDLEKNVLRIHTQEVRFLSEHELPEKARIMESGVEDSSDTLSTPAAPGPSSAQHQSPPPTAPFPGGGRTLGTTPAGGAARTGGRRIPAAPAANRHSEETIRNIVALGVTKEMAISTLDAAGGNLEVAASLLF